MHLRRNLSLERLTAPPQDRDCHIRYADHPVRDAWEHGGFPPSPPRPMPRSSSTWPRNRTAQRKLTLETQVGIRAIAGCPQELSGTGPSDGRDNSFVSSGKQDRSHTTATSAGGPRRCGLQANSDSSGRCEAHSAPSPSSREVARLAGYRRSPVRSPAFAPDTSHRRQADHSRRQYGSFVACGTVETAAGPSRLDQDRCTVSQRTNHPSVQCECLAMLGRPPSSTDVRAGESAPRTSRQPTGAEK